MKKVALSAGRSGAIYLANELDDYMDLQKQVSVFNQDGIPNSRSTIIADKKDWLIFGRQSPGYVRNSEKTPKKEIVEAISSSPLVLKGLGTRMDNEKHYDLFEGSDFLIEPITGNSAASKILVKPEQMMSTNLDQINDSDTFEVGFARKQGFANISQKSPLFHSSIGLRMVSDESPASSDSVVLTGAEVKQIIKNTNEEICEKQHCNLITSNCYSAATFAMGEMVHVINARTGNEEKNTSDIRKISSVLATATLDNFGRGVSNNLKVKSHVTTGISEVLAKRSAPNIVVEPIQHKM